MGKITPFLWFDANAEEAIRFYTSVFKDSKIGPVSHYGDAGPGRKGQFMTGSFFLNGQEFIALNGGPQFKFTEAISFVVHCEDQQEVDYYWDKLCEGGAPSQCGWLKDKFGLSWQIVPTVLPTLLRHQDPGKAARVMKAMLKMSRIDIKALQDA
jgi:predicted 3-demethylubiquinone-9 3-methyltransferase (glyoxalase superfamily)